MMSFLHYFHSAISNHLSIIAISMSPEWSLRTGLTVITFFPLLPAGCGSLNTSTGQYLHLAILSCRLKIDHQISPINGKPVFGLFFQIRLEQLGKSLAKLNIAL